MAEEISEKNNQTDKIKKGKTLGKIINDLPMVKNFRETAPKLLGKYDFCPAIIAALRLRGEISDDITVNTIMSAKEEDFIRDSLSKLIEQVIVEDVSKNVKGIIIYNGKINIDASIDAMIELGMNPEEAGGAFAAYNKELPKEEQKISINQFIANDPIDERLEKECNLDSIYEKDNSFTFDDYDKFIQKARENVNQNRDIFNEPSTVAEATKDAEDQADKYKNPQNYTEEEIFKYGDDFERKKGNMSYLYSFFNAERKLDSPEKYATIKAFTDYYKIPSEEKMKYLEQHPEIAKIVTDSRNIQIFARYEMSNTIYNAINAYKSISNMIGTGKYEKLSDEKKAPIKRRLSLSIIDGLRRAEKLGLDDSFRKELLMALKYIAPELVQENENGYALVDKKTLLEELSIITGQQITNEKQLNMLLRDVENKEATRVVDAVDKIKGDKDIYEAIAYTIRNDREKTRRNMMNAYMTEIDLTDVDYATTRYGNMFGKNIDKLQQNFNEKPARKNAVILDGEVKSQLRMLACERASLDECAIFISKMNPDKMTDEEKADCIEKLMLARTMKKPGTGQTYFDSSYLMSLFKKINPDFVTEYGGRESIDIKQLLSAYNSLTNGKVSTVDELTTIASKKSKMEYDQIIKETASRTMRIAKLESDIEFFKDKGWSEKVKKAQKEIDDLKAQESKEKKGNVLYSEIRNQKEAKGVKVQIKGMTISEAALSRLFNDGEELLVETKEQAMDAILNDGTTVVMTPPNGKTVKEGDMISDRYLEKLKELGLDDSITLKMRIAKKGNPKGRVIDISGELAADILASREAKRKAEADALKLEADIRKGIISEPEEVEGEEDLIDETMPAVDSKKVKSFDEQLKVNVDIAATMRDIVKRYENKEKSKTKGEEKKGKEAKKKGDDGPSFGD